MEEEQAAPAPEVVEKTRGVSPNDREGKCKLIYCLGDSCNCLPCLVFSVFQIVKFQNGKCMTTTGDDGTCYTEAECLAAGGEPSGPCASSFGVCCLCKFSVITGNANVIITTAGL